MKHLFIVLLLLASAVVPGAVVAQQNETSEPGVSVVLHDENDPDVCEAPETIDRHTSLCHVYTESDGRAVLIIESERTQRVTITDSASFMSGGEIPRKRVTLREGTNTVRFPVTVHRGFAGVSIDTGGVLFGVPVESRTTLIGGPWTYADAQIAALGGASSVALVSVVLVMRRIRGKNTEPERIA